MESEQAGTAEDFAQTRHGSDIVRLRKLQADGRWRMAGDVGAPPEASPITCASQVAAFPRDPEHVPAWLEDRLHRSLVDSAPDAGWLDAPAGHLSLQDLHTVDGMTDRGHLDDEQPAPEEIARRLGVARRIAETLPGRGVPALAKVDRDDGEHEDQLRRITHREAFVLMRHAHEAAHPGHRPGGRGRCGAAARSGLPGVRLVRGRRGPASAAGLVEATGLTRRQVQHALAPLRDAGQVVLLDSRMLRSSRPEPPGVVPTQQSAHVRVEGGGIVPVRRPSVTEPPRWSAPCEHPPRARRPR